MPNYSTLRWPGKVLAFIGNRVYPGDRLRIRDRVGDWFHNQAERFDHGR